MFIRRWVIGIPLATVQASGERLSKVVALAVFSSDALSSVAYATEEMLSVLVLAGGPALGWCIALSLAVWDAPPLIWLRSVSLRLRFEEGDLTLEGER